MKSSTTSTSRKGKLPPSADLLVCFPSRAHLTLRPKPICSPARPPESNKCIKKTCTRIGGVTGQASPLLWAKSKGSEVISEPTSPKVTCAGQIKVKPKPGSSSKNWQSVMEEIEKLHNRKKHKKNPAWMEAIGLKKDVMQFLTCLRNIKFEFRCFGSFPSTVGDITTDDEDEDEEEEEEENHVIDDENNEEASVFSKWFMVLDENHSNAEISKTGDDCNDNEDAPCAPPPNALLLMRCRSAPPKSWLQQQQQQREESDDGPIEDNEEEENEEKSEMENKKNLVVMNYGSDFYKFSADIAKETWVVGGIRDSLSRSRSWKR